MARPITEGFCIRIDSNRENNRSLLFLLLKSLLKDLRPVIDTASYIHIDPQVPVAAGAVYKPGMKPGTIWMVFYKLFRAFYRTDKLITLSILFSVPPDIPGEHLKTSNTERHIRGSKISGGRSAPSGVFGDPWPGTKTFYYIFNNSS